MDDLNLAFDLAIHTAPKDRSRAIDRYARAAILAPEFDEGLVLDAMRHARFTIIGTLRRHDVAGLVVEDLFRGGEVWLVDEGLESSLPDGAALATRLCTPEGFAMTASVLVPIDIELIEDAIADTPQLLRNHREELIDDRRFAEAIYEVALASGLMEQVACHLFSKLLDVFSVVISTAKVASDFSGNCSWDHWMGLSMFRSVMKGSERAHFARRF